MDTGYGPYVYYYMKQPTLHGAVLPEEWDMVAQKG